MTFTKNISSSMRYSNSDIYNNFEFSPDFKPLIVINMCDILMKLDGQVFLK